VPQQVRSIVVVSWCWKGDRPDAAVWLLYLASRSMDTWWIDEPVLVGSPNPTNEELEQLRVSGFSVIVCLLDIQEQTCRYATGRAVAAGWEWHNIAIRDFSAPSIEQLKSFVALMATLLPQKAVVVHCQGGTGRTGTMAAAYWIGKGLSAAQAIARVRQRRPNAVETPEQEAVLEDFARLPVPPAGRTIKGHRQIDG
jgi:protein-tyrosine phosphatase